MENKYIIYSVLGILVAAVLLYFIVSCSSTSANLDARCVAQGYPKGAVWQFGQKEVYCLRWEYKSLSELENGN